MDADYGGTTDLAGANLAARQAVGKVRAILIARSARLLRWLYAISALTIASVGAATALGEPWLLIGAVPYPLICGWLLGNFGAVDVTLAESNRHADRWADLRRSV